MKRLKSIISIFVFLICFVTYSCNRSNNTQKESRVENLPYYESADFTPIWMNPDDPKLKSFHRIPPFELINQNGKTISEKSLKNKIYITDFFFTTCPGICPRMTDNMLVLQDEFIDDSDVLLLSHSVTPEIDSVAVLKAYAEKKKVITEKWHLLTGDRKAIYDLGRKGYFVEENMGLEKSEDDFLHTENFVLIDKGRFIRGIYNGLKKNDIQQLIADVRTLKKEK